MRRNKVRVSKVISKHKEYFLKGLISKQKSYYVGEFNAGSYMDITCLVEENKYRFFGIPIRNKLFTIREFPHKGLEQELKDAGIQI